ncbi:hypothetical protein L1987_71932 [Smallanthus sonchifolius]|uniref:Uncharacterized protein n=1 Tax=Smallanthus sonchifolius TaxID=185202 RepID=A0ACB9AUN5_9ASTR|nr:hypothetical protein L1987_71932 [Smallanthus sonchifolius]
MEGGEEINSSGVTVVGSDAASDYHISPRTEPPITGSTVVTTPLAPSPPPSTAVPPPPPLGVMPLSMKKKRGRPRKYGPDGSVTQALSPKPISSGGSSPVIDFSSGKRGKIRLPSAGKHHQQSPKIGMEGLGDWFSCSVGANFTPHIINVNAGEDVTMKVISFSQQGPRAICILSATGVISSVTLRQPNSSGGTLTYEGRFEILSLAGSFMPSESGGIRNRSGGMSVSLASPDGRVVGGGVAGLLVAASPVQIVVGSFLTGNQHEQKTPKKLKPETVTPTPPPPPPAPATMLTSAAEAEEPSSASVKPEVSSPSFRGDNWSAYNAPESRKQSTDINVSLH